MATHDTEAPAATPANPLVERFNRWLGGESHVGHALGSRISRALALPQLRRLVGEDIPWKPLAVPVAQATVALVTTSGVHLRGDRPFGLNGDDASFRVIPRGAEAGDLTISHQAYDRRDALRDINLVFPLQRLRELEAEGVIGAVAEEHYGFGLVSRGAHLLPPGREVADRLHGAGVDLALLVPA